MNEPSIAVFRVAAPERPLGQPALVEAIASALVAARARGERRMLLDLRALTDFPSPSLAQRDAMIHAWARVAAGEMAVAVVAPPHLLDPERFGVHVAAAAGMRADAFEKEADARAWLERQSP